MVKKLFRHELQAYWRVLIPIWALLTGVSVLGRLIQLFENDSVAYGIVRTSTIIFYAVALLVCLVFPFVFSIMRFHKNLFTGEGYLSFTLPVTPFQHVLVKATAGLSVQLLTVVVSLISLMLITMGDVFGEIMKAIGYLYTHFYHQKEWGMHLPRYLVEGFLLLVIAYVSEVLLYYACISIGQRSKKNRILAAVGVYFAYYFIRQVLGTIVIVIVSAMDWTQLLERVLEWVDQHPFETAHYVIALLMLVYAVAAALYFLISHRTIRNRLNLE